MLTLGHAPVGVLVALPRQGPLGRPLQLLEEAAAAAVQLLEGPLVEPADELADGGVELGQAEEGAVPESGQDPALDDEHAGLDFGLVARLVGARRHDRHPIPGSHLPVGGVEQRLVAMGPGDARSQVVADRDPGHAAEELEGVNMARDPVRQLLGGEGLGVQVVAGPQHGDEDLGRRDHAGDRVDDRDRRPRPVDEELLAGAVLLPHDDVDMALPLPVAAAELAVLVAVGRSLLVLKPQQLEGDVLAPQLLVRLRPVRQRPRHARRRRRCV